MPGPILQYLAPGTSIPSSPRTQSSVEQSRGVKEVRKSQLERKGRQNRHEDDNVVVMTGWNSIRAAAGMA